MRWSFTLWRVGETAVRVHVTFVLLVAWFAWAAWQAGGQPAALRATALLLSLFACVLLHEFGHIAMARRFGVRTPEVILLPIGGLARLERIPEEPRQELLIALAGPAVTAVLAALFAGWAWAAGLPLVPPVPVPGAMPLAVALLWMNLFLLGFNLLPAFPMDGGRVLRAALASRLGLARATRIAATVGQGFALLFGVFGFMQGEILLMLVALFVFLGAGAEAQAVATRLAGRGLTAEAIMVRRFDVLPVHATLQAAADLLLAGDQREFPVVDNDGRLEGLLTRENLIHGLSRAGAGAVVGEVMTHPVPVVAPATPFETAVAALQAARLPALPVVDGAGTVVGILSQDNLAEALLVRRAGQAA